MKRKNILVVVTSVAMVAVIAEENHAQPLTIAGHLVFSDAAVASTEPVEGWIEHETGGEFYAAGDVEVAEPVGGRG